MSTVWGRVCNPVTWLMKAAFGILASMKMLTAVMSMLALSEAVMIVNPPQALAAILRVPGNHRTIQDAIDAAAGGDVILVGMGRYYEHIDFSGKAITVTGADPNNPTVVAATIIDGSQKDRAVSFSSGEGRASVLRGITIQKAGAELSYGGIYCSGSSPTISNCLISENQGAGIYCSESSALIADCTISENGDGITCWRSSPEITRCLSSKNLCCGIYCGEGSSPTIANCRISENLSTGLSCVSSAVTVRDCTICGNNRLDGANGGGIRCLENASPTIAGCLIVNNSSGAGGGIYCDWDCSPAISNCLIAGNSAALAGGGILCSGNASPLIVNCLIARNSVVEGPGGGIHCDGAGTTFPYSPVLALPMPKITNCTITQNSASQPGGGISSFLSCPAITNCILWADLPNEVSGRSIIITYSDIQGGYSGRGNIRANPLFTDPGNSDWHLKSGSPCINAGTARNAPAQDNDGHPRDSHPDMGAFEHDLDHAQAPFRIFSRRDLRRKW
ncbi:MAG: right-handed parallel beta-helix repeat-containing protein [bacterium]